MDSFTFWATDAACAKDAGVTEAPGSAIFRTFDESPLAYSGPAAEEDLQNWLKAESVATLFEFDEDSVEPIFHEQKACVILLLDGDKPFKAVFEEASKELKGQILFSYSGVSEGIQEQLGEFIGVTAEDLPTIRIIEPSEESVKKFKFEGDVENLTVEDVRKFITEFTEGKLVAHMKSDPIPETQGAVKVVVGKNFHDIVMDDKKDVLVKYYAPWCGHCQKLAPHWDQLGEHVKDVENLVIAKYDATTNENDEVQVEGFPTLTFYAAGDKTGAPAEGRSFNGLRKWLKANSAVYKAAFPDEEVEDDAEEEEEEGMEEGEEGYDEEEGDEGEAGEYDDDDDMANLEDYEDMEDEAEEGKDEL
jgi:protein disulfide isomerase